MLVVIFLKNSHFTVMIHIKESDPYDEEVVFFDPLGEKKNLDLNYD